MVARWLIKGASMLIGLKMILKHKGEIDADADFKQGKISVRKKK